MLLFSTSSNSSFRRRVHARCTFPGRRQIPELRQNARGARISCRSLQTAMIPQRDCRAARIVARLSVPNRQIVNKDLAILEVRHFARSNAAAIQTLVAAAGIPLRNIQLHLRNARTPPRLPHLTPSPAFLSRRTRWTWQVDDMETGGCIPGAICGSP